ncbi:hypothetical protein IGB42_02051 [Andreprevotia sp. IGB-42]|nr:hypothetical protein IGB42_02051 [Andreprevotia sp. IGB-42]
MLPTPCGNANAVEFISPQILLAGGTGYLAAFEYKGAKFKLLHSLSAIPVRNFIWNEKKLLIVNQGIHGIRVFSLTDTEFFLKDTLKPPFPVDKMAVSACGIWIGFSSQMYSILGIAKIECNA